MAIIIPRAFIIGLVIFSMLIAGGISMLSQVIDVEDIASAGNITALNKLGEIKTQTETLQNQTKFEVSTNDPFGFLGGLIKGAYTALLTIWSSLTTMTSLILTLGGVFSLPVWVTNGFTAIITVLVSFMIISLILKTST